MNNIVVVGLFFELFLAVTAMSKPDYYDPRHLSMECSTGPYCRLMAYRRTIVHVDPRQTDLVNAVIEGAQAHGGRVAIDWANILSIRHRYNWGEEERLVFFKLIPNRKFNNCIYIDNSEESEDDILYGDNQKYVIN